MLTPFLLNQRFCNRSGSRVKLANACLRRLQKEPVCCWTKASRVTTQLIWLLYVLVVTFDWRPVLCYKRAHSEHLRSVANIGRVKPVKGGNVKPRKHEARKVQYGFVSF